MIFKGKPRFDQLDLYLARRDYGSALEAITEEIKRRPENFNLLLRQAEVLGQAGDREQAISVYRDLARHYTDQGFFARAIAVTNKILLLDPERKEVTSELAELIAAQKESEQASRKRMERAVVTPPPRSEPQGEPAAAQPGAAPQEAPPPAPEALAEAAPEAQAEAEPEAEPKQEFPPPAQEETTGGAQDELELAPIFEIEAVEAAAAPSVPEDDDGAAPSQAHADEEQARREREASQFFAAFPQTELEELLSSTSVRTFRPDQVIVREGEPGASLFLIETGSVEVVTRDPRGAEVKLAVLGAGDFFGEVAVLAGVPRTATIVAREPVTLIEISGDHLIGIASSNPEVRKMLERFYRKRAQATVEAMLARLRDSDA